MQKQYVILFLPQPKRAGSTLESWNLLSTIMPLRDGVENRKNKTLVIYTSGNEEDVKVIKTFALNNLDYQDVKVYARVQDFSATVENYIEKFSEAFISDFTEDSVIEKIFWTMGTIFPGVENFNTNGQKITELLQRGANEKVEYKGADYMEHIVYQSLLNFFLGKNIPMIHQLIVDPVEADVSIYIHELMGHNIRRHFVHPLINRPSVYVNPFIVLPFFNGPEKSFNAFEIVEKTNDFVFGLTAYDETRKKFLFDLKDILFDRFELKYCYFDDDKKLVDTRLSYEDYMKRLSESKTTLLIPAYDASTFSVHRFVEAISLGCLPIIFDAVYEFGFAGYSDTIDFIASNLVIDDIMEINSKIDQVCENHDELLRALKKTSYFRMLQETTDTSLYYK